MSTPRWSGCASSPSRSSMSRRSSSSCRPAPSACSIACAAPWRSRRTRLIARDVDPDYVALDVARHTLAAASASRWRAAAASRNHAAPRPRLPALAAPALDPGELRISANAQGNASHGWRACGGVGKHILHSGGEHLLTCGRDDSRLNQVLRPPPPPCAERPPPQDPHGARAVASELAALALLEYVGSARASDIAAQLGLSRTP